MTTAAESTLFDRIVEASGLAPLIAPFTVRRLLIRCNIIPPETVTAEQLLHYLPAVGDGLSRFLNEEEHERAITSLRALATASR